MTLMHQGHSVSVKLLSMSVAAHETPGCWLLFVRLQENIIQLGMLSVRRGAFGP